MNERFTRKEMSGTSVPVTSAGASGLDMQAERITAGGTGWPRILVIGHADSCAAFMRSTSGLLSSQIDVDAVLDPDAGCIRMARWHYDLVVLLLSLPRAGDAAACRGLRAANRQALILVLDAGGTVERTVSLLEAGADAYLPMSLHPNELRARLKALLRRQLGMTGMAAERLGDGDDGDRLTSRRTADQLQRELRHEPVAWK